MRRTRFQAGGAFLAAALLGGCATPSPAPAPPSRVAPLPSPQDALEAAYRERAQSAVKDRRWADAVVQWEVLSLLRPQIPEYRAQVEQTQRRIAEISAEALRAGDAARKRGELEAAQTQYLRVLAVDPDHVEAMQALREMERERVRRAYFTRAPRNVLTMPTPRNGPPQTLPAAEVGVVLLRQGDYAGAIQALGRHLQAHPTDEGAKELLADANFHMGTSLGQQNRPEEALAHFERARMLGYRDVTALNGALRQSRKALADEYVRQGNAVLPADRRKAVALWEQALKVEPSHAEAIARLRQNRTAASLAPNTAERQ
jgi:tetratricopeptide (TPR) repeat protein